MMLLRSAPRRSGSLLAGRRYHPIHPALEFRARQHNLAVAAKATNADICPNANDAPGISATGMPLTHLNDIANGE